MSGHPGGHPSGDGRSGVSDAFARQYAAGVAPWDIGRPQPEMVALEEEGTFGHRVLEVGCGRGALSIYLAEQGHEVLGVDSAEEAIGSAREAARGRDLDVVFVLGDALDVLGSIHDPFDAVVDVGFFHALDDESRERFISQLARVLWPGGVYAMLAFSDRVPGTFGPRRISAGEIRAAFAGSQWAVRELRPADLQSAMPQMPVVDANLAVIERV